MNHSEAFRFAQDLYDAFKAAGWEMLDDNVRVLIMVGEPLSVLVKAHGEPIPLNGTVEIDSDSPAGVIALAFQSILPAPERWQRDLKIPEDEMYVEIGPP